MIPPTKQRKKIMENVIIHRGPHHTHEAQGLPQFYPVPYPEVQKEPPIPAEGVITYKPEGLELPEDFEHLQYEPEELDDVREVPIERKASMKKRNKVA